MHCSQSASASRLFSRCAGPLLDAVIDSSHGSHVLPILCWQLERLKDRLLSPQPPAVRSAWTEETRPPVLTTDASLAALSAADERMAQLVADSDEDTENQPMNDADLARLSRLLAEDDEPAPAEEDEFTCSDDPAEMRKTLEAMEVRLKELTLAQAMQEQELELRQMKASLQAERIRLAEASQALEPL